MQSPIIQPKFYAHRTHAIGAIRCPGPAVMCGEFYREVPSQNRLESVLTSFRCYICGADFEFQRSLRYHEAKAHKFHRCSFTGCEQTFPHQKALALHERTFHHLFKCASCNTCVKGCALIPKHLCNHHGQSAPFVCICEDCGVFFLNAADHAHHLKQVHYAGRVPPGVILGARRTGSPPNLSSRPGFQLAKDTEVVDNDVISRFVESLLNDMTLNSDPTTPEAPSSRRFNARNVYQFDPVD